MNRVLIPLDLSSVPSTASSESPTQTQIHGLQGKTMGTMWSVKVVGEPQCDLERIRAAIQQELDLVVSQMSTWIAESNLSRFNAAPADTWHDLPDEFFAVIDCARIVARESDGAYDPTVGPLVNLWGFGPDSDASVVSAAPAAPAASTSDSAASRDARRATSSPPSREAIAVARARSGWQRLDLDASRRRARQPGDLYVDLSSIAKGYGVDRVANRLRREGVGSYLVEVGGELRGFGVKPDGQPWWVALEHPDPAFVSRAHETTAAFAGDIIVALHGLSVATSGDYRRYFDADGIRYSHTIDPRTGAPVTHRLASVTVLHPQCMVADARSTALTVLGVREGFDYACRHQLAALFISRTEDGDGFEERMTPAFAAMLDRDRDPDE